MKRKAAHPRNFMNDIVYFFIFALTKTSIFSTINNSPCMYFL